MALVGFKDLALADLPPVPLAVVATATERLAETAIELLLDRIAGSTAAPVRIVLPVRLVGRGSGEI